MNPNARPLAMLNVSGMVMMIRNAGIDSTGFDQGISAACAIISEPTTISAGAVAAAGIAPTTGAMNIAIRKKSPATIAVTPERPPDATPAALSMQLVTVDVHATQ